MSDRLVLTLEGNPTLEQLGEVLGAMNGLLRALAEEVCGDPDAVEWILVSAHVEA